MHPLGGTDHLLELDEVPGEEAGLRARDAESLQGVHRLPFIPTTHSVVRCEE